MNRSVAIAVLDTLLLHHMHVTVPPVPPPPPPPPPRHCNVVPASYTAQLQAAFGLQDQLNTFGSRTGVACLLITHP